MIVTIFLSSGILAFSLSYDGAEVFLVVKLHYFMIANQPYVAGNNLGLEATDVVFGAQFPDLQAVKPVLVGCDCPPRRRRARWRDGRADGLRLLQFLSLAYPLGWSNRLDSFPTILTESRYSRVTGCGWLFDSDKVLSIKASECLR